MANSWEVFKGDHNRPSEPVELPDPPPWRDPKLRLTKRKENFVWQDKVKRIVSWLYDNVRQELTSNASSARQVLDNKVGDCTEFALLFTALARAEGIPARRVSGLVYMGDGSKRFAWHEWNEVVLDGHWVPVDASWNEPVANATHLKLGVEGNDDSVMVMGALKLSLPPP